MTKLAVITGASSGIGEAYAKKFAELDNDVILIARNKKELEKVKEEIQKKNNVNVQIIVADLSKDKDLFKVQKLLAKHDVGVLVNNAGFGIAHTFIETEPKLLEEMIKVHVMATTILSRAVLPKMMEKSEGTIINIASIAVFFKNKKSNTIYSSTKNYVMSFSQILAREVKNKNIKVQVVCPGYTKTHFMESKTAKGRDYTHIPEWMWMMPEDVVLESINSLNKKKTVVVPGRVNKMIVFLLKTPCLSWVANKIVNRRKE